VKSKNIKQILDEVYEDGKKTGNGLSLDYLHEKSDKEVMQKLTGFKGIGVKTATCVLLFCLRRAAFPVDTHVFRISRLLGWVPTPQSQREDMERESAETKGEEENQKEEEDGEEEDILSKPAKKKKLPPVTRDTTFQHLDAKIPAELKYALHQLLIRRKSF
jgi:endonuclease III